MCIVRESEYADNILNKTPILSNIVGTTVDTYTEVYNIMHDNKLMSELEINEEVLNLALGQNHKVALESSPLKRYLSIDASDNVISFFENFGTICGKWDIIKEEIHGV